MLLFILLLLQFSLETSKYEFFINTESDELITSYDKSPFDSEKLKLSTLDDNKVFICKSFNEHFRCKIILGFESLLLFKCIVCWIIFPPFGFLPRFFAPGFGRVSSVSSVSVISCIKHVILSSFIISIVFSSLEINFCSTSS